MPPGKRRGASEVVRLAAHYREPNRGSAPDPALPQSCWMRSVDGGARAKAIAVEVRLQVDQGHAGEVLAPGRVIPSLTATASSIRRAINTRPKSCSARNAL